MVGVVAREGAITLHLEDVAHLPISRCISLYLAISRYITLHLEDVAQLPVSRYISLYLAISRYATLHLEDVAHPLDRRVHLARAVPG